MFFVVCLLFVVYCLLFFYNKYQLKMANNTCIHIYIYTVWLNKHPSFHPEGLFGGLKNSGIGREGGGRDWIKQYADVSSVF